MFVSLFQPLQFHPTNPISQPHTMSTRNHDDNELNTFTTGIISILQGYVNGDDFPQFMVEELTMTARTTPVNLRRDVLIAFNTAVTTVLNTSTHTDTPVTSVAPPVASTAPPLLRRSNRTQSSVNYNENYDSDDDDEEMFETLRTTTITTLEALTAMETSNNNDEEMEPINPVATARARLFHDSDDDDSDDDEAVVVGVKVKNMELSEEFVIPTTETCVVCQDEWHRGQQVALLGCGSNHTFCIGCSEKIDKCPLCRGPSDVQTIVLINPHKQGSGKSADSPIKIY